MLAVGTHTFSLGSLGLVCFFYRRFREFVGGDGRATLAAASLFALFHLPNPLLAPAAFATGIVACWLYRREPNILVLGLLHALVGGAIRQSLGADITYHMRVGPGFFGV